MRFIFFIKLNNVYTLMFLTHYCRANFMFMLYGLKHILSRIVSALVKRRLHNSSVSVKGALFLLYKNDNIMNSNFTRCINPNI